MQRLIGLCLAMLLALAVGCGEDAEPSGGSSGGDSAGKPITIGIMSPFSGDYGYWGESFRRGVEAYREVHGGLEVDGRPVEIEEIDDQCDVGTAVPAFQRNSADLAAVIGPGCSAVVEAVEPLAAKAEVPLLIFAQSATLTNGYTGGWLFRTSQPDTPQLLGFARDMGEKWKERGITKVAVLHDTSVLNKGAGEQWAEALSPSGIEVVADETFELGDTDFTAQVLKAKQSGAQAVAIASYGPEIGRVAKRMAEAELDVPIAAGTDTAYKSTIEGGGKALEGAQFYTDYLAGSDDPGLQELEATLKKLDPDVDPQALEYESYLGISMLMEALKQPGAADGGQPLSDALHEVSVKIGELDVSFLPNGDQSIVRTFVGKVQDGASVIDRTLAEPRDTFPDYKAE